MKIKCPKCSFENLKGSEFCQECGFKLNSKLPETKRQDETGIATTIHEEIEKIDDVIFKPKEKRSLASWFVIITFVGLGIIALFMVLVSIGGGTTSPDTPTTEEQPTEFPISYLNITDYDVIFDDNAESYFVGTLKNAYSKAARSVRVRLDFYRDEALKQHFDTRTVTINNGAEANGAFSFEVPLTFYPQGLFWWLWKIEGADYGL